MAERLSWYHGHISTNDAVKICTKNGKNGSFLLRDSQREEGAYTLSVFNEKQVYHYRIKKTEERKLLLKVMMKDFDSWEQLLKFMTKAQNLDPKKFPQPLVKSIDKSVVQNWDKDDHKWRESLIVPNTASKAIPPSKRGYKKKYAAGKIVGLFRKYVKKITNNKQPKSSTDTTEIADTKEKAEDDTDEFSEQSDNGDNNSFENAPPYTLGEKGFAVGDSEREDGEMEFKNGNELYKVNEVPPSNGWLYCWNETQKVYGWVNEKNFQK